MNQEREDREGNKTYAIVHNAARFTLAVQDGQLFLLAFVGFWHYFFISIFVFTGLTWEGNFPCCWTVWAP
jgi:hypothetical protein